MVQQLSGLSSQRGASVTSVVFIIIVLGVAAKLLVAIARRYCSSANWRLPIDKNLKCAA